jgi:hypothetical protein
MVEMRPAAPEAPGIYEATVVSLFVEAAPIEPDRE